jgi:hypothetical protein
VSTYKKEFGTGVQNAAGTLSGVIEGQLWYDSTAASFKYQYPAVTTSGSWATGGSLNTARPQITAFGTQTAGLFFGGSLPPPQTAITESYNGSAFSEVNDLNTARRLMGGAGTSTAGLGIGGLAAPGNQAVVEQWNGTSWTEVADINTARYWAKASGTDYTSVLHSGGSTGSLSALTESWNGTSLD